MTFGKNKIQIGYDYSFWLSYCLLYFELLHWEVKSGVVIMVEKSPWKDWQHSIASPLLSSDLAAAAASTENPGFLSAEMRSALPTLMRSHRTHPPQNRCCDAAVKKVSQCRDYWDSRYYWVPCYWAWTWLISMILIMSLWTSWYEPKKWQELQGWCF